MKTLVIHHKDSDGYVSALVVKAALQEQNFQGEDIQFLPYTYYEPIDLDAVKQFDRVYMVDISLDTEKMLELKVKLGKNLIWIDHHKSAILKVANTGETFAGLQSTEEAACVLCWRYFYGINRKAPVLVESIGRFDTWQKSEDWDTFVYPLNLCVMTLFRQVDSVDIRLLNDDEAVKDMVSGIGTYLQMFDDNNHANQKKYVETRIVEQNGQLFNAYVLNSTVHSTKTIDMFESETGISNDVKIIYNLYAGKVRVSVFCDSDNFDCSEFASRFEGGGGHKDAAGFVISVQEFEKVFK